MTVTSFASNGGETRHLYKRFGKLRRWRILICASHRAAICCHHGRLRFRQTTLMNILTRLDTASEGQVIPMAPDAAALDEEGGAVAFARRKLASSSSSSISS